MRSVAMSLLCGVSALSSPVFSDNIAELGAAAVAYDADLFNKDKRVFFINAEFLYWLAGESAMQYAVKMDSQPWSQTADTQAIGEYQNAAFHWAPGGRLSFGYFNAPHYWDVIAQYTYIHPTGHQHTHAPSTSGEYLNGTWVQPKTDSSSTPLQSASSHLMLNYNLFEFLFSRRFQTNEHLRINLTGGLAVPSIHQHWSIHYKDTENLTSLIRNHWRFDGVGIKAGLKLDWYMGWDIYLVASGMGGIVTGWYKNTARQNTSYNPAQTDSSRPIYNTSYEDHRLSAMGQMMLGPSWQKRFKSTRVELVTGYELTVWTNLNEVYRTTLDSPQSAKIPAINTSLLTLQGLTARLSMDF